MDADLPGVEPETNARLELSGGNPRLFLENRTVAALPRRSGMYGRCNAGQVADTEIHANPVHWHQIQFTVAFRPPQILKPTNS